MTEPKVSLFDLMYGEHGLAYEHGTTLGERAWILAETVRRRYEQAGYVVRAQDPTLPEKVKQLVDQREREIGSLAAAGQRSVEFRGVDHGEASPGSVSV